MNNHREGMFAPFVPVQVAAILRDVEATTVPARGIRIVLEVDEALFIRADELLVTAAVGNLVDNAVELSPDDAVISLSMHAQGDVVSIRVDNECSGLGHGEPRELCPAHVTQPVDGREGLGLAITSPAEEAMNGHLSGIDRRHSRFAAILSFPLLTA